MYIQRGQAAPFLGRPMELCARLKYYSPWKYNRQPLSEHLVMVTRKGQVTIPVEHRRRYKIREGMKVRVIDSPNGLILKPVTPIEDLAGIDAGKISLDEMHKRLDEMRSKDRY